MEEALQDKGYDVFICYSHQDKDTVKDIAWRLKRQGIKPWLDEWNLKPGLDWQKEIENEIQQIRSVAVFIGKDGLGPWQNIEVEAILKRFAEEERPIIHCILPECEEPRELPLLLGTKKWIDLRKSEPDPFQQLGA